MGLEIERKWLVVRDSYTRQGDYIWQGYLPTEDGSQLRIRTQRHEAWLTIKRGSGIVREETEIKIPEHIANALEPYAVGSINKVRCKSGPWELDTYSFDGGRLLLMIAEIELDSVDAPIPEPPAGLRLGPEITDDSRFTAQAIAKMSSDQRKLLHKIAVELVTAYEG